MLTLLLVTAVSFCWRCFLLVQAVHKKHPFFCFFSLSLHVCHLTFNLTAAFCSLCHAAIVNNGNNNRATTQHRLYIDFCVEKGVRARMRHAPSGSQSQSITQVTVSFFFCFAPRCGALVVAAHTFIQKVFRNFFQRNIVAETLLLSNVAQSLITMSIKQIFHREPHYKHI